MKHFNLKLIVAAISSLAVISSVFAGDRPEVSGGLRRKLISETEASFTSVSQRLLVSLDGTHIDCILK